MQGMKLEDLRKELHQLGSPQKAANSTWFFKTGPGQYGEGDVFIGVTVPEQRKLAKRYADLSLEDLSKLIDSSFHEERLTALIILVNQFKKADEAQQEAIYNFYLEHIKHINNWDLVDASACYIVGPWLEHRSKDPLTKFARSGNLWERRIAMIATFDYIKKGKPEEALRIAEILINDQHDLIQKAVGWMLREVGKRCSFEAEAAFLNQHYQSMPRTALRYAIEHFPPDLRQYYLKRP